MTGDYDYILVDGESSACVAAWRLAKDRQARVLLIERGPARASGLSGFFLPMPAAWMKGIRGSPIVEMHQPVPQKHLNGRAPDVGQAAILGGGSSVNAVVYARGQHADYDDWDRFMGGGSGWAFSDMLPHFRSLEYNHQFQDEWHGVEGPLHVSPSGFNCQLTEDYILAVQGLGVPYNPDFNGAKQAGVGPLQYTTYQERRWNGVDAYLPQVIGNPKLTVETEATVSGLIVENGHCKGVAYVKGGREREVRCAAEVLMAAGSYNTPKTMMLSGIGAASHVSAMGIKPVHDLPGVGENLQDHHEVPVVAATVGHYGYYGEDKGWRALWSGLQYRLFRAGPVASVGIETCAYVDPEGGDRPTLQMYCVPTVCLDGDVRGVEPQDGVTVNACLLRPRSRGTVRFWSADPFDEPVVDNDFLADPDDLRLEVLGLYFAREVLKQKPISSRISHEMVPGKGVATDVGLAEHCCRTVKTSWHPTGTCRMGPDGDPLAVLDKRHRLRGIDGLCVIDASTMPFVPSGNTNAPTMALADRAMLFL